MSRIVEVAGIPIGSPDRLVVLAGPCSVESKDQLFRIAEESKEAGADGLRGGAYKPRTTGGEWQGLQEEGLEFLALAKEQFGLPIITEILDSRHIALFKQYGVDIFQIGARSAQVQILLQELGVAQVPVLYKNGMNTTHKEWMGGLKHITEARGSMENIILCMRGRNVGTEIGRNSLDLVSMVHYAIRPGLPLIVDPSHASGLREYVYDVALTAVAAGAHGLLIETHHDPVIAMTDGAQSILPKELALIIKHARMEHALYIQRQAERREYMQSVELPEWVRLYFKQADLGRVQPHIKDQEVKPYVPHLETSTDILVTRVRVGKLSTLLKEGFAIGRMRHLYKELPHVQVVDIKIKAQDTIRLSPYEAEAVHERGGKTTLDTGSFKRRINMRHAYADTPRNAFFNWEVNAEVPKIPLVLYEQLKG